MYVCSTTYFEAPNLVGRAVHWILCSAGYVLVCLQGFMGAFLFRDDSGTPTDPFTILEHKNPSIDIFELNKARLSSDFEALKL